MSSSLLTSFRLFVPLEPIERHFRQELSAVAWQNLCFEAGVPVFKVLDLKAMRKRGELKWWNDDKLLVGRVKHITRHPNANQLIIVEIDYGADRSTHILTSTPSLVHFIGASLPVLHVPYAAVGAQVVSPHSTKLPRSLMEMKIKTFRGLPSDGMVCSEREVGLGEYQDDIFLLPADVAPGTSLRACLGDAVLCLALATEAQLYQFLENSAYVIESINHMMESRDLTEASSH